MNGLDIIERIRYMDQLKKFYLLFRDCQDSNSVCQKSLIGRIITCLVWQGWGVSIHHVSLSLWEPEFKRAWDFSVCTCPLIPLCKKSLWTDMSVFIKSVLCSSLLQWQSENPFLTMQFKLVSPYFVAESIDPVTSHKAGLSCALQ